MEWLAKLFTKYPEMGVYLAVGIGYLIGRLKFRGVGLGVVTGSLLGGILIGNFFHVPVSDQAKSIVFLLFLFGIGYSVGPSFFQNLKGDGWRWALLGAFVPVIGLLTAYTVAHFLKLDPGYSAGLLSGSLTESPAIGTASEAIRSLSLPDEQKQLWIGHIAVADAICYIFGTLGVIWCCSSLGPKLLRIRSASRVEESGSEPGNTALEALAFIPHGNPSAFARTQFLKAGSSLARQLQKPRSAVPGARLFVERIRRKGDIFSPVGTTTSSRRDDTVAVLGRTEIMIKVLGPTTQ